MRLYSLALLPLPLALASAYSHAQQQPLQVYLHPTPQQNAHSSSQAIPTLSADQAKAILTHHLGGTIGDFDEIPYDEGLWGHLVNMWKTEGGQAGTGGLGSEGEEQKARLVFIDGGVSPQDVLPTTLSQKPSFYLSESTTATTNLLEPYMQRASHLLQNILDSLPSLAKSFKDTFELAGTKAAAVLGHELSCLTALADSIPWIDHSSHSYPWEAITISGLKHVEKDQEMWQTASQGVKAGLASMTTPGSPPLLLIIRPDSASGAGAGDDYHSKRSINLQARKDSPSLAKACYESNQTCSEATDCNGRGSCVLKTKLKTKDGETECWGCKCASGFAGTECQKTDYSIPFIILIFSTVLVIALIMGSVSLLMSVGDTKLPSTLNLAVGGPSKRD